jgi:hypothetical protein
LQDAQGVNPEIFDAKPGAYLYCVLKRQWYFFPLDALFSSRLVFGCCGQQRLFSPAMTQSYVLGSFVGILLKSNAIDIIFEFNM